MAGSLNRATILGNLGKDPEIRTFQDGGRIANFSVATSERWKDRNSGEERERCEWHNVVIKADGLVGVVEQYLRKGDRVLVEGQIQTRKWQDHDGQDRYSTEIVVSGFNGRLILLTPKDGGGSASSSGQRYAPSGPPVGSPRRPAQPPLEDEIPW